MDNVDTQRQHWLDALKFFSMIIVFLCHFKMSFFYDKLQAININGFLLPNYFFDGNFAVCMFLLISCYLYSMKSIAMRSITGKNAYDDLWQIVKKRYFRLCVPAIIVNTIIFFLYISHLFYNNGVYNNVPYVDGWFSFTNIFSAFLKVCWTNISICLFPDCINPPLWCYNFLFFLPVISWFSFRSVINKKQTIVVLFFLIPVLLLHNTYFSIVPLSISLAYYRVGVMKSRKITILVCAFIILITCIALRSLSEFYGRNILSDFSILCNILLSFSIFAILLSFEDNCLNSKIFSKLNKISFGVFLLHMPIICSVGFKLYICGFSVPCIFFVVLIVLALVSYPFHLLIEKKLTSAVARIFEC